MVDFIPKKWADFSQKNSLSLKFRKQRMLFFLKLLKSVPKPVKILDVGGTKIFWKIMGFLGKKQFSILILNLEKTGEDSLNIKNIIGNAEDMSQFKDREFDVVFSNSVIEHLEIEGQRKMAQEIQRIGKRYFVQTPNKFFPIEPHFLFPFFQFVPSEIKAWLLTFFSIGWVKKAKNFSEAQEIIKSINLLDKKTIKKLFPDSQIYEEKKAGLTKSFIVYKGF